MQMFHRLCLLLTALAVCAAAAVAQKVSLNFDQAPLEQVLTSLTQQTGSQFSYSTPGINPQAKVSAQLADADFDSALSKVCSQINAEFTRRGTTVFLTPKKAQAAPVNRGKAEAPTVTATGTVIDATGEPLIGAIVTVKGTNKVTVTDIDGNFSFADVPEGSTIEVKSLGYLTAEMPAASEPLNFELKENSTLLGEVVVVGYGTQRKSDITGSVSSVKAADLAAAPVSSTAEALQGRVAGVAVQNTSGDPSGSTSIRIRGSNSLTYGNDPLVIIDGVQDASLSSLNPNQIESMEVLKDAAALSIYGSRGANGVIIVTTKGGRSERAQITYNGHVSFDRVNRKLPWLAATDYASLMNEAQLENGLNPLFTDAEIPLLGRGTDWQDEIFRHSVSQVHNIGIGGQAKNVNYYIAGGITDKNGIIVNSDFKEYSLRANLKAQALKNLSISLNTFASYSKSHKGDTEQALTSALKWSPTKSIFDDKGNYVQPGGGIGPVSDYNPVGLAREIVSEEERATFNIALQGEYTFTDWLKFSTMLAYKSNSVTTGWFDNQVCNLGPEEDISGSKGQSSYLSLQSTSILSFNKEFGPNRVQATAVYEFLKDKYDSTLASARGIPVELGWQGVHFGTIIQKPWLEYNASSMMSFMGRVNYAYKDRYMVSASIRGDGASQLAPGHKWDCFWAVSGGWNIAEEKFMDDTHAWLTELKLRASYGSVGNAAVPAYSSHLKFTPGTDASGAPTLSIAQLENKNLKWERTKEFNIGVDARFFNGKLNFTAEYYAKKTTDLLMWRAVPTALGVESVLTNIGAVRNRGWEFALGGTPVSVGDFYWNINYSINFNRNRILKLDGISNTLINSGNVDMPGLVGSFVQMVGQPMGTFLGYQYAGVWKQEEISTAASYGAKPGDAKYVDVDRNGVIDKDDIGIIGNSQPKFTYGINNTFHYRNFDLNVFFQGVYGNDIYNQNRVRRESYSGGAAFPTNPAIANHWTPKNQSDIPAFSGSELVNSSRWVEDGSYLRLKNLTLGYSFSEKLLKKIFLTQLRLYVTANNLWTITNYKGFDPEASMGMDASGAGVDRAVYPSSKSWVIGLDITF